MFNGKLFLLTRKKLNSVVLKSTFYPNFIFVNLFSTYSLVFIIIVYYNLAYLSMIISIKH